MRSPEAAPLVGLGATPQPFHGRPVMPNALNKGRRQRSVPASNFARPQTRLQAALSTNSTLSRQMGATDQHREKSFSLGAGLFCCRDFASAEATRGLCGRPLDCFAHTPMFLDFYCCRGNRAGGRDQRAFRSPFGNLRRRHFWGCLRLGSCCCKKIPRLRVQIRRTNPPPFKKPPRFARSGYCYPQRFHISCTYSTSMSSNASSPFFASAFASPWRTKHIVTKLRAEKIAA